MTDYRPPVEDMQFLLHDVLGFDGLDRDMSSAILEEAAKLASDALAPLNKTGDQKGATLKDSIVKTSPGFKDAYKAYCDGGWNAVPFDANYGGQGLPYAIAFPVQEMWQGANMSFGLCPLLNQGAVEAIHTHGTPEQKSFYLPRLISGEWTGTMNLTEAQAGSDIGLLRTKAERAGDGTYKITGQKIFITYGEHDLTDNIIHLILARLPDAPEDVKGISLFIVPKILENGRRNTVSCIGIEHKLGIHASPTCTMDFAGATAYLIGEEHQGLKCMFTMMNNARLSVGLQGVAIAERSYQQALAYARQRVQGKAFGGNKRVPIVEHPDVKRMLLTMQSQILAGRLLTYSAALALDKNDHEKVDLLTPIVKSWCTDMACEVTSIGIQVHGGMGYIEETGAAQFYRDARILPIYEGTNGIQALDLVFRKVLKDNGKAAKAYIAGMKEFISDDLLKQLNEATELLLNRAKTPGQAAFIASPYLQAFACIAGGALTEKAGRIARSKPDKTEIVEAAEFYRTNLLPFAGAHMDIVLKN